MVIFHSYVSLPEGKSHEVPMNFAIFGTSWSSRRAGSVSPRQRWRAAVAWHFTLDSLDKGGVADPGKRLHNELENHHFSWENHH